MASSSFVRESGTGAGENVKSAKRNISHRHKTVHRSTGETCRDALHKICELFEIMTVTSAEHAKRAQQMRDDDCCGTDAKCFASKS